MGVRNRVSGLISLAGSVASMYLLIKAISRPRRIFVFQNKVVLITDGSRGLGLVLARKLAAQGVKLALLARSQEEMEQVGEELRAYDCEVLLLSCDVRDQVQVKNAITRIVQRFGRLDILINHAGIVQVGPLEQMNLQDFQESMDINFWGPLYLIMASKDIMKKQGGGRIVNIASISGKVAFPHLASYSASKSALMGLSDSLRAELAKNGIIVTTVVPGLLRSESSGNTHLKVRRLLEATWLSITNSLSFASASIDQGAEQILEAIRRGDSSLVISPNARILILGNAVAPDFIANLMKLIDRFLPGKSLVPGGRRKIDRDRLPHLAAPGLVALSSAEILEENLGQHGMVEKS